MEDKQKTFIEKAKKKYGDKFDYSKVVYSNAITKIIISCKLHGDFVKSPNGFLQGKQCPECAKIERKPHPKNKSLEQFIEEANKIHNNFYDYSKVEYTKMSDKIIVLCPKHGEYQVAVNRHLSGMQCNKCGNEMIGIKLRGTFEEFVKKSHKVHDNKYTYKETEYIGQLTKIQITCSIHGEFIQTAKDHMRGSACPKCSKVHRRSLEELLNEFNEIHDNKYTYPTNKWEYSSINSVISIICPTHNEFTQKVETHLRGSGCPKCVGQNRTTAEFITLANQIHNNFYDYSLVDYKATAKKVKIICPLHGVWEQTPNNHLYGFGCDICGNTKSGIKQSLSKEEFVEKSNKMHNNIYDYSLVNYINNSTYVEIICPIHKIYKIRPDSHMRGGGCKKCAMISLSKKLSYSTEKFISLAKEIHGDKYDYSLVKYINSKKKITLICQKHNKFEITPVYHLQNGICQRCNQRPKRTTQDFIEIANDLHNNKYNYDKVQYVNAITKVIITCKIHGDFLVTPHKVITEKSGCSLCINKTEGDVINFLKKIYGEDNILSQFKPLWCLNLDTGKYFSFDICIPSLNLIIEIDGNQHFEQVGNWTSPDEVRRRDIIKSVKAINNGYSMIRILQVELKKKISDTDLLNIISNVNDEPIIYISSDPNIYDKHKQEIIQLI